MTIAFDMLPAGAMLTQPADSGFAAAPADQAPQQSPPLVMVTRKAPKPPPVAYIKGLEPDQLGYYLEAFDRGELRTVVPIWRKMARRDGHLNAVIEKRLGRIAMTDWEVTPVDDSPEAQKQAEFLGAFFEDIPSFTDHVEGLSEAIKYRVAGREIEWLPGAGPKGELRCRLWDWQPEDFDLTSGAVRLYADPLRGTSAIELPADKFVIHLLPIARMEPSSILFVMKQITAGQWLSFGDKFGTPGLLGNHPAGANQNDIDKFYDMLCNWASELAAAVPEGYTVTPVNPGGGAAGALTWPQLIEWADKEVSKVWTGHTLLADAASGSGTLAGEGAADQLLDITKADCRRIAQDLDTMLAEPAVRFQFGQPLLAHFHFKVADPTDLKAEADIAEILVNIGVRLPAADVYTRFGWRMPEGDEAVIEGRPQPALASGGFGAGGLGGATPFKSGGWEGEVRQLAREFAALKSAGIADDALNAAYEKLLAPMKAAIADATSVDDMRRRLEKVRTDAGPFADAIAPLLEQALRGGWDGWLAKTQGGEK